MNDFFEENGGRTSPETENTDSDVSLDTRKEQLEYKVNQEMNAYNEQQSDDYGRTETYSNYTDNRVPDSGAQPRTSGQYGAQQGYSPYNTYRGTPNGGAQPRMPGSYGAQQGYSPYNTNVGNYNSVNNYTGPYGYTSDYTKGSPYLSGKPPKKPMKTETKAYIGMIIALMVIFSVGFVIDCANNAGTTDIWDFYDKGKHDYSFDYDSDDDFFDHYFGSDTDFADDTDDVESEPEKNNDIVAAPEPEGVINSNADKIKAENQPSDIDSANYNAKKAYKAVEKSVVGIVTYTGDAGIKENAEGEGTGIIVTPDGYIVTNSHVISDTKDIGVEVITTDGTSYAATVVGFDSRTDLALIKINAENLVPAVFVDSDQIEVGQDALAVGNPGGMNYSNSLTRGAVSALNRTVSSNSMVSYIQTDAAINPGNSGGPLLNIAGQVMGINTIKIVNTEYEGMGFAIPSNTVIEIVNDLMTQGYVSGRVRIGIVGQEVSPYLAAIYDVPQGIMINEFSDDSPLKDTDAKVDDIITAVNGEEITSFTELFSELAKYEPGKSITVTLFRPNQSSGGGKTFDVKITLVADEGETQSNK